MMANIDDVLNLYSKLLIPTHPNIARELLKRKEAIVKIIKFFTFQLIKPKNISNFNFEMVSC